MKQVLLSFLILSSVCPAQAISRESVEIAGGIVAACASTGCTAGAVILYKEADNSLKHTLIKPADTLNTPAMIATLGLASLGLAVVSAVLLHAGLNSPAGKQNN